MDDEKLRKQQSQLVVKNNDMIQKARYNLTATQQKFLAYLISMIKPTDTELKEYVIRVEDFCLLTGINKTYFYSEFKDMIDDLDNNKTFWVETEDEVYKFRWFADTSYIKGKGTLKIILSKRLTQYLIGLTKNFTQYELYNILALKSKYAIRLFELFKSYAYQHKKTFDIDNLKDLLYANTSSYKNFANFKAKVLEPAITEINEYTELEVSYEKEKKGKKVIGITFKIIKKEPFDAYRGYRKTLDKLNERNGQIKGQISIYDIMEKPIN